jgi:hypothetical protein
MTALGPFASILACARHVAYPPSTLVGVTQERAAEGAWSPVRRSARMPAARSVYGSRSRRFSNAPANIRALASFRPDAALGASKPLSQSPLRKVFIGGRAKAQPEQREASPDCAQDAAACRGSRRDRGKPSCPGRTMDLRPRRAHDISRPINHRTDTRQNPRYPRDRIPVNKASSLQSHSKMGVLMRRL